MKCRKYWLVDRLVPSQWPEYGEHHSRTPLMCSASVPVCRAGEDRGHYGPPASVARRPRGSPVRSLASTCCRVPDLRAVIVKYYCQISFQPREGASEQSMVVRPSWDQSPVIQCSGGSQHQHSENRDNGNYRPRPHSHSAKGTESTTL